METLKAIGVYDDNTDMVVVAGGRNTLSPDTPDEKILLHGNCARKHLKEHPNAFFLQGCPPGEGSLYMSVLQGGHDRQARADALDPRADGDRRPRLALLRGKRGEKSADQTTSGGLSFWKTPQS